jgi:copper oxidase (laccase) domain-containing protein
MVIEHQPQLALDVIVAVSSRDDGSMKAGTELMDDVSIRNRAKFLTAAGTDPQASILQKVTYSADRTYDVVRKIDDSVMGATVPADALYTYTKNLPILLPLADCVGVVMYHADARLVAVLHSGRHSTFADLTQKVLGILKDHENLDITRLKIWLSPAVSRESYKLEWFDYADSPAWKDFYDYDGRHYYVDLPGYIRQQCLDAGVPPNGIIMPATDTAVDHRYYSHSQGDTGERFAIMAMMR